MLVLSCLSSPLSVFNPQRALARFFYSLGVRLYYLASLSLSLSVAPRCQSFLFLFAPLFTPVPPTPKQTRGRGVFCDFPLGLSGYSFSVSRNPYHFPPRNPKICVSLLTSICFFLNVYRGGNSYALRDTSVERGHIVRVTCKIVKTFLYNCVTLW